MPTKSPNWHYFSLAYPFDWSHLKKKKQAIQSDGLLKMWVLPNYLLVK
jgi:hypothetical protein